MQSGLNTALCLSSLIYNAGTITNLSKTMGRCSDPNEEDNMATFIGKDVLCYIQQKWDLVLEEFAICKSSLLIKHPELKKGCKN